MLERELFGGVGLIFSVQEAGLGMGQQVEGTIEISNRGEQCGKREYGGGGGLR